MKYFQLLCKAFLNREEESHAQGSLGAVRGLRKGRCSSKSEGKDARWCWVLRRAGGTGYISGHTGPFMKAQEKNENGQIYLKLLKEILQPPSQAV